MNRRCSWAVHNGYSRSCCGTNCALLRKAPPPLRRSPLNKRVEEFQSVSTVIREYARFGGAATATQALRRFNELSRAGDPEARPASLRPSLRCAIAAPSRAIPSLEFRTEAASVKRAAPSEPSMAQVAAAVVHHGTATAMKPCSLPWASNHSPVNSLRSLIAQA